MSETSKPPTKSRTSLNTPTATVIAAGIGAIASIVVAIIAATAAVQREAPRAVERELEKHAVEIEKLRNDANLLKTDLATLNVKVAEARKSVVFTKVTPLNLQLGDRAEEQDTIKITAETQTRILPATYGETIVAAALVPTGDVYRITGMDRMKATPVLGSSGRLNQIELELSGKPYGEPNDNKILEVLLVVHYRE